MCLVLGEDKGRSEPSTTGLLILNGPGFSDSTTFIFICWKLLFNAGFTFAV